VFIAEYVWYWYSRLQQYLYEQEQQLKVQIPPNHVTKSGASPCENENHRCKKPMLLVEGKTPRETIRTTSKTGAACLGAAYADTTKARAGDAALANK
jgi:hypothetical protein